MVHLRYRTAVGTLMADDALGSVGVDAVVIDVVDVTVVDEMVLSICDGIPVIFMFVIILFGNKGPDNIARYQ